MSIVGTLMSAAYFLHKHQWVALLGNGPQLIPYTRNLILIYRKKREDAANAANPAFRQDARDPRRPDVLSMMTEPTAECAVLDPSATSFPIRPIMKPTLSICVPVYNEAENLPLLHEAIARVIDANGIDAELILVDDGSRDGSLEGDRGARGHRTRACGG